VVSGGRELSEARVSAGFRRAWGLGVRTRRRGRLGEELFLATSSNQPYREPPTSNVSNPLFVGIGGHSRGQSLDQGCPIEAATIVIA